MPESQNMLKPQDMLKSQNMLELQNMLKSQNMLELQNILLCRSSVRYRDRFYKYYHFYQMERQCN